MKKRKNKTTYNLPINLHSISVKIVKGLNEKEDCWGQLTEDDRGHPVIELDSILRGEMLKTTLFHEAFHAVFHLSGTSNIIDEKQEEALVRSLENIFIPLLPSLFSLLTAIEGEDDAT